LANARATSPIGHRDTSRWWCGHPIAVTLRVVDTPRDVDVPPDFAAALTADKVAGRFFAELSNSLQRYHTDNITAAKTDETRRRRIDKAISLFRDGKQR